MKKSFFTILLTLLMSMMSIELAYGFAATNSDGVTIYYGWYYRPYGKELYVTGYSGYSGNLVIPEAVTYKGGTYPVTAIGLCAFSYCDALKSVTIPSSVTSIGEQAFRGCKNLTSIVIPNSVMHVGSDAFDWTPWYENQPNGVLYVGKVAYCYHGEMPENTHVTIKEGIQVIGNRAFDGRKNLTSISIPNSITIIESHAFENCSSLVNISIPNSITIIESHAFWNCI